jgi:prepilin-type N-terminal cleavage/methylation domain-containing protein
MKIRSPRAANGFTVIELLVVIVLVCILALFVALANSGVRADNRNGERQKDVDTIKRQLEAYSAETQVYPTLANLNDPEWRTKNLPKLKEGDLHDPRWKDDDASCSVSKKPAFADKPTANCYSYQVTASDGNACDNSGKPCAHYTLTATLEGGGTYVKGSLN